MEAENKNFQISTDENISGNNFKSKKLLLVTVSIIAVIVLAIVAFFFLNTGNKFEEIAKKHSFIVEDFSKENLVAETKEVLIAVDEEDGYQIEYLVFNNSESARNYYTESKLELEEIAVDELEDDETTPYTEETSDYQKYSISTTYSYFYITRDNNTVIYVNIPVEYKDEAIDFINEIEA